MLDYLLFVAGLSALVYGADRLVASAVRMATASGISTHVVGIVIVGLGTSLPELVTSVHAALLGAPDAALGNVIGSNIANILLVLGLGAMFLPILVDRRSTGRDVLWVLAACAMTVAAVSTGTVERWMGLALVGTLVLYLQRTVSTARKNAVRPASSAGGYTAKAIARDAAIGVFGIVLLVAGAHVAVDSALVIATAWGLSASLAGLLLLALGTSLPELVVTVVSLLKRESDVAVGNVVGSTLFNLLGILGVTATLQPLPVPQDIAQIHIWVMTAAIAVAAFFVRTGWRLSRLEGALLLAAYPIYLAFAIWPSGS